MLRQVIDLCLKLDARLAEPGEFSLRALANGRMNLAQAEAVRDLIDAQTAASARQAVRQMRGEFSNQLQPIKDDLLDVIVVLESALEFVEDDLPEMQAASVKVRLIDIAGRDRPDRLDFQGREAASGGAKSRAGRAAECRQVEPFQRFGRSGPGHRYRDRGHHARPASRKIHDK